MRSREANNIAQLLGAWIYIAGAVIVISSHDLSIFVLGWCLIQGLGIGLCCRMSRPSSDLAWAARPAPRPTAPWPGSTALGAALGPVIGGFLTTFLSWRWAFGLEIISLVPVIVFSSIIPRDQPITSRPGIDKLGLALQAGAMIAIVLGILLIGDYGLLIAKKPLVIAGVDVNPLDLGLYPVVLLEGLGTVLLILFVKVERRNARNQKPSLARLTLFGIVDFVNGLQVRSIQVSFLDISSRLRCSCRSPLASAHSTAPLVEPRRGRVAHRHAAPFIRQAAAVRHRSRYPHTIVTAGGTCEPSRAPGFVHGPPGGDLPQPLRHSQIGRQCEVCRDLSPATDGLWCQLPADPRIPSPQLFEHLARRFGLAGRAMAVPQEPDDDAAVARHRRRGSGGGGRTPGAGPGAIPPRPAATGTATPRRWPGRQTSPRRTARATAAARESAPSLARRFSRWRPTVRGLMARACATSLSERPSATRRSTSSSRGVRSKLDGGAAGRRGRAPADRCRVCGEDRGRRLCFGLCHRRLRREAPTGADARSEHRLAQHRAGVVQY